MKTLLPLAAAVLCAAGCASTPAPAPGAAAATRLAPPSAHPAPAVYRVRLDTTRGPVLLEITRADAPYGADRFYAMVTSGFLTGARFFRVVPGFVVQFGLPQDPQASKAFALPLPDDPVVRSNARGTVTFAAGSEPNSRTTQLFVNLRDNRSLNSQGFAPIGRVVDGLSALDAVYSDYGEDPDQDKIEAEGGAYLAKTFPRLDYIRTATLVPVPAQP